MRRRRRRYSGTASRVGPRDRRAAARRRCCRICTALFVEILHACCACGQELGRRRQELASAIVKSRFIGVLVTAVARWSAPIRSGPSSRTAQRHRGAGAAPPRGGQIVASIRGEPRSFNRLVARDQTDGAAQRCSRRDAGPDQPRDLRARAVAGRDVGVERRRPHAHAAPAARRDLVRRHAVHLGRRAVLAAGASSTRRSKSVLAERLMRRRQADPRRRARRRTRSSSPFRRRRARACGCSTACRSCRSTSSRRRSPPARSPRRGTRSTPPAEIVGTGPFVLREYQPGQRLVFDRNPRYWRKAADGGALPYLDRIVLEIVPGPERRAAAPAVGRDRPDARASCGRRTTCRCAAREEQGTLRLIELGVGPDADALLVLPEARGEEARTRASRSCRSPSSARRSRTRSIARRSRETVFLGAAVPVWGPITPGNTPWFSPDVPRYPHDDDARARAAARASASRIATATAWSRTRRAPRRASR